MKFDELDNKMRVYEKSLDQTIVPGNYIIARLDGRSFTRLTKETCNFEAPFDVRFRDLMVNTVKHLMKSSGLDIVFGYTESDEISLLFDYGAGDFGRKVRKLNTILAGEASAFFSMQLGNVACFDCRIIPLPNGDLLKDYFSWRMEDAHRNSLNSWCYWTLRKEGLTCEKVQGMISGLSVADKNELLFQHGINYNDLPSWQKRGVSLYWKTFEKRGWNPIKNKEVVTERRDLFVDYDIPEYTLPSGIPYFEGK